MDSPITKKSRGSRPPFSMPIFYYHTSEKPKNQTAFGLQIWLLVFKTGFSDTKIAFRLQIFTCRLQTLHFDLQSGFSFYYSPYKKFVKDHNIDKVSNCFLMPTEGNEIIDKGYVSMKMLDELGLEKIQLRLMPASEMYEYYIKNKKMEISLLKL